MTVDESVYSVSVESPVPIECLEFLRRTDWFDENWYLSRCPESAVSGLDPLQHYLTRGVLAGIGPNGFIDGLKDAAPLPNATAEDIPDNDDPQLQAEIELIAASGLFHEQYYLDNNPDVAASGIDPLHHFCRYGWRDLRKPHPGFDVWWYWINYLDPAREAINPLLHHSLVGQHAGYATAPAPYAPRAGHVFPAGAKVRRICLFAGYDPDGIVDDYVVAYLRELSRHADVYYLADGVMQDGELDKLRPHTLGRWACRHGAYDFGSWSALAREYVGWDEIAQYDELILVNDSSYLLGPLDHVFAKMDAKACDWWGLQATKGLARTRGNQANQFAQPIPMDEVKAKLIDRYEDDGLYDFLVGSYFVAYRQPVIRDTGFRRQLEAVHPQKCKLRIIQKYEIGFTHYLISKQFAFDTFIDHLYPFHPIYTGYHFDLIREGFPLFKRYFLSQNHYNTPGLARWKDLLLGLVPDADVDAMERNLWRVADHDKLLRSFSITENEDGDVVVPVLLNDDEFRKADEETPTFDHWWAFPACAFNDTFAGNERALFEEVRNDPSIKKIVLTRRKAVHVDGENVVVVPLSSPEGQYHLLRARQIFIKHSPTRNLLFPVSPELHNLINLWHGIPLKRIGYASLDMQRCLKAIGAEHAKCRAVISSSKIDSMAMASAFYPLSYDKVWNTGLPRNDFIVRDTDRLPGDLRAELHQLEALCDGRRLVLFVPTFKAGQEDAYYHFQPDEVAALRAWLHENNAVLGVREHMADHARTYFNLLRGPHTIDLSDRRFTDVEVLYRKAAALVTDYSSCFIDFMLTGRPMVSFAYDYDNYANAERGLFYDMEHVFPGPVCHNFPQFMDALGNVFKARTPMQEAGYAWKRRLFFDHLDDGNAWRVVKRVKNLYIETEA
ncbi:CDP-glycerol glycerophosphotransferase family protein [Lysobacter sp. H23M47]|uniref:CDP-glycerol glycerophosphotransferase family protein n=1 Tax=Lysobacter sp. H23M47 TaxID=2781024 RepID=UPI00187E9F8F|nr:CDP-glycerol glycerophosphotransferase family protein [Lysobacter sp. H23M47]QOW24167.1 CDP-glycerol glycerophosphotransferase family protein [Lysobacter sp. H23M47]